MITNYVMGKTIESIDRGDEHITFYFTDGTACESMHMQDCCETVAIERIEGNLDNILNSPVLYADENNDEVDSERHFYESHTWTTQIITTEKGTVKIIWLGESNGYYGESPYTSITHGKKV